MARSLSPGIKWHDDRLAFSNTRKHEQQLEQWTTVENIETLDNNLEDLLVHCVWKLAWLCQTQNTASTPHSGGEGATVKRTPATIKPSRLYSVDKTEVTD